MTGVTDQEKIMQVAVIGAGAVGCYYGGLLLRAGHDVTFIGRQPHVDAINAHGLLLDTKSFKGHLPAKAATDTTALNPPDLVLVCVKSADTEHAGRSLAGRLRPETSDLSLQNGVDNAQRLHAVTGHAVISAVVYVGSEMAGPGHIRHHGGGDLAIGASPASAALAQTLEAAGVHTTIADDIEVTLWSKLVINCAFNALSAVADISYGPMLEVDGTRDVVTRAVQEAIAVARACGVAMPDDLLANILNIPTMMPAQKSSTAQDLARGKPSEIDFLNGHVVRKGAELGIPTPTNHALQVMVKLAQRSKELSGGRT
jgi:2-dehydropantoate 2-reductase